MNPTPISQSSAAAQRLLLQRQEELRALLDEAVGAAVHAADDPADLSDFKELAHDEFQHTVQDQVAARARLELDEVNAALRRIDDHRYGQCTGCGAAIAPARLQALPYAALCMRCQAASEQAGQGRR